MIDTRINMYIGGTCTYSVPLNTFQLNVMRNFTCVLLTVAAWGLSSNDSRGQGCSDAGFCTINSFKPNSTGEKKQLASHVKVGAFGGTADNSISVFGTYVEYGKRLSKRVAIDAKVTTIAQTGNNISTFGLADIFISTTFQVDKNIRLTLGAKAPLMNANKTQNNVPLPMDYQSSLGTFDFVAGIGFQLKKWQLMAAIQQPLTQNNNQFFASSYPNDSKLRSFQSTNGFKRAGDVLLRVAYPVTLHSKWKFTPSLLPIYHLANDRYMDENRIEREIIGSRGLTLNANTFIDYEINTKNAIQLNIGIPLVIRDVRPDGLTRGFIASLEYRINF